MLILSCRVGSYETLVKDGQAGEATAPLAAATAAEPIAASASVGAESGSCWLYHQCLLRRCKSSPANPALSAESASGDSLAAAVNQPITISVLWRHVFKQ